MGPNAAVLASPCSPRPAADERRSCSILLARVTFVLELARNKPFHCLPRLCVEQWSTFGRLAKLKPSRYPDEESGRLLS
jgi:hypothetical protein